MNPYSYTAHLPLLCLAFLSPVLSFGDDMAARLATVKGEIRYQGRNLPQGEVIFFPGDIEVTADSAGVFEIMDFMGRVYVGPETKLGLRLRANDREYLLHNGLTDWILPGRKNKEKIEAPASKNLEEWVLRSKVFKVSAGGGTRVVVRYHPLLNEMELWVMEGVVTLEGTPDGPASSMGLRKVSALHWFGAGGRFGKGPKDPMSVKRNLLEKMVQGLQSSLEKK